MRAWFQQVPCVPFFSKSNSEAKNACVLLGWTGLWTSNVLFLSVSFAAEGRSGHLDAGYSIAKQAAVRVMGFLSAFRPAARFSTDQLLFSLEKDLTLPEHIKGSRGKYVLCETLGQGVTSVVRAGFHVDTNSPVAVKVLDLHRLSRDSQAVNRVDREIRILQKLAVNPHPNVVSLKDLVRNKPTKHTYVVMERVGATSLQSLIDGGRRCPPSQVASIVAQTLAALQHIHRLGFVHGDIKPANILLAHSGKVCVADFGSAEVLSAAASTCGTPAYQAPEFLHGTSNESAAKVDVWALGVTAFYALAGERPFSARSLISLYEKVAAGEYAFPEEVQANLPADALDAVRCMLNANFHSRWSVDQLLEHPWVRGGLEEMTDVVKLDAGLLEFPEATCESPCVLVPRLSSTMTVKSSGSSTASKFVDVLRDMREFVRRLSRERRQRCETALAVSL